VAAQLEAGLKISQAADVTKVLPPGAAQVQPLVEVFFVLADVRSKLKPPPEEGAVDRHALLLGLPAVTVLLGLFALHCCALRAAV
jgi:hypothetical protein